MTRQPIASLRPRSSPIIGVGRGRPPTPAVAQTPRPRSPGWASVPSNGGRSPGPRGISGFRRAVHAAPSERRHCGPHAHFFLCRAVPALLLFALARKAARRRAQRCPLLMGWGWAAGKSRPLAGFSLQAAPCGIDGRARGVRPSPHGTRRPRRNPAYPVPSWRRHQLLPEAQGQAAQ